MKNLVGVVIAACLIYLCVVETLQLVAMLGAVEFAQQELSDGD